MKTLLYPNINRSWKYCVISRLHANLHVYHFLVPSKPVLVTFVFVSLFVKRDHENLTCNLKLWQFLYYTISFVDLQLDFRVVKIHRNTNPLDAGQTTFFATLLYFSFHKISVYSYKIMFSFRVLGYLVKFDIADVKEGYLYFGLVCVRRWVIYA